MYGEQVCSRTFSVVKGKVWVGAEEESKPFFLAFSPSIFVPYKKHSFSS